MATVTGSQSFHEQYAKEANLQRKQEIYGPLHSELKALRERFEEAHRGFLPYPQAIKLLGDGLGKPISQGKYSLPSLDCWPQFKKDYRRDSFTEAAQKEFEHLHQYVHDFNAAMAANHILERHLTSATKDLITSDVYQHWFSAHSSNGQLRQPPPPRETPNSWFGLVAQALSFDETPESFGQTQARYWLNNGGVHPRLRLLLVG